MLSRSALDCHGINENSQKIPISIFHLEKEISNVTSKGGYDGVTVPGSTNNHIL